MPSALLVATLDGGRGWVPRFGPSGGRILPDCRTVSVKRRRQARAAWQDPCTPSPRHRRPYPMQVEIWSDVVCPFCYIGKRKFEAALAQLPERDRVEVVWRSFQLGPDTKTDPTRNAIQN